MKPSASIVLAALVAASLAGTAHAATQTFSLDAVATDGGVISGGLLTFTIDLAQPTIPGGDQYLSGAGLLSFDFVINGQDFSLAGEFSPGSSFVQIDAGAVTDVQYLGTTDGNNIANIDTLTYQYGNVATGDASLGVLAVAVPEPASMAILAAGLGGLVLARRRRQPSATAV